MKKTILLGTINKFSMKANLWGFALGGILFIINGTYQIISNYFNGFDLILGILMIPFGIWYLVYGFLSFRESSKFAPRFSLDENELLFKETLMKSPVTVPWDQIKKIQMAQYRLDISTSDTNLSLGYLTNPEISKKIKSTIRGIAESKQIEVIGG